MSEAFKFEAEVRLLRWSESSTTGRTITIELPPDVGDGHPFRGLPTGHQHGQRFVMKFSAIGDDEQPIEIEPQQKSPTRSAAGKERYASADAAEQARTRSVLLAKRPDFQAWCGYRTEETAAAYIRRICGVDSRSAIGAESLGRFLAMEEEFKQKVGQMAEMRG